MTFSDELSSSSHFLGNAVSTQQCEKNKVRLGMSPTSEISQLSCLSVKSVSFLTLMLGPLIGYDFMSCFFLKGLEEVREEIYF